MFVEAPARECLPNYLASDIAISDTTGPPHTSCVVVGTVDMYFHDVSTEGVKIVELGSTALPFASIYTV